jgi:hypothetical protein
VLVKQLKKDKISKIRRKTIYSTLKKEDYSEKQSRWSDIAIVMFL